MVEIVEGSERRFDRRMAAIRTTDRPWASRARAVGYEFVIGTLAIRAPNWMNRRQVDDVEAHRANLRQTPFGFAQCRRLAGNRALRARKHLVPCAEARARPVGYHLKQRRTCIGVRALAVPHSDFRQFRYRDDLNGAARVDGR